MKTKRHVLKTSQGSIFFGAIMDTVVVDMAQGRHLADVRLLFGWMDPTEDYRRTSRREDSTMFRGRDVTNTLPAATYATDLVRIHYVERTPTRGLQTARVGPTIEIHP